METPVKMVRDAKAFPESHEANVRRENVAEFESLGWSVEGEAPARRGRKPKDEAPAEPEA